MELKIGDNSDEGPANAAASLNKHLEERHRKLKDDHPDSRGNTKVTPQTVSGTLNGDCPPSAPSSFIDFESPFPPDADVERSLDISLLAWLLVLYRYNRGNDVHLTWGCNDAKKSDHAQLHPRISISSSDISFGDSDSVAIVLERMRDLRRGAPLNSDQRPQFSENPMFFNDAVSYEPTEHSHSARRDSYQGYDWSLQLDVLSQDCRLYVKPAWREPEMTRHTATNHMHSFIDILNSIYVDDRQTIASAVAIREKESRELWRRNATVPPTIAKCMHDLISERAVSMPASTAVCAWDGELAYWELDKFSTALAHHLATLGIKVGAMVPLCFEKSMWTVVALLAVMKAGGAFVLMDPAQPEARLRTIAADIRPRVILTSEAQTKLGAIVAPSSELVPVSQKSLQALQGNAPTPTSILPSVPPSAILYLQFTSGSTGKPKGVVISHSNYTSGAIPRSHAVGYEATSRVLDFASYAFDVSIDCMLCTLVKGGCVCVPSNEDRINDLSGAIRRMNVNVAHITPSVARVLDPNVMGSLKVLGLGGESVSSSDAAVWGQLTKIVIAYGPSECTVGCTINHNVLLDKPYTSIGNGVGGVTWIVDPDNHNQLAPPGAVGELLIEGPIVGVGYFNDPQKTSAGFIKDPSWLLVGSGVHPGRSGRLYKTGDLVKYDPDGDDCIVFIGRKDTQVKLRGQRIELGEVEHHLCTQLPQGTRIAVEVIKPGGKNCEPTLVAFISEQQQQHTSQLRTSVWDTKRVLESMVLSVGLRNALNGINRNLAQILPVYMIPSAYIQLPEMPMMVSGKTDRKELRKIGSAISSQQFAKLRVSTSYNRPFGSQLATSSNNMASHHTKPKNKTETLLQEIWCRLITNTDKISPSDNFFSLGGNSIIAMKLVSAARAEGLGLTVADIFSHPQLSEMALIALELDAKVDSDVHPFSLLPSNWKLDNARVEAAELCNLDPSVIEDVYPCAPLQEGLMALSSKVADAYIAQRIVELPNFQTCDRLQAAWEIAVSGSQILRTRIIHAPPYGLMQVVINEGIIWIEASSLQDYLERDRDTPMELGAPLARYAIIVDAFTDKRYFVWTTHHAMYDGWSIPLVLQRVSRAYRRLKAPRNAKMNKFIKYLCDMDHGASKTFWRVQLRGATGPQFPPIPSKTHQAKADSLLEKYVLLKKSPISSTTIATLIRGSWALVASGLTGSDDVVFGETLTGRSAPIPGVEQIEGPMITTVPVRIRVDRSLLVKQYLKDVHAHGVRMMPHEHLGLQHIRRVSPDAQTACDLRTGLVIQPESEPGVADGLDPTSGLAPAGDVEAAREALKFNSYPLMLVCLLDKNGVLIMASFDSKTVDVVQMERVLAQLEVAIQKLAKEPESRVGNIQYLSQQEREEIWKWNGSAPAVLDPLTRNLVLSQPCKVGIGTPYPNSVIPWIVDLHNPQWLAPIGVPGELLLEGPLSSPNFMEDPGWLLAGDGKSKLGRHGRLFGTGDLAKYSSDGTIIFMGRKGQSQNSDHIGYREVENQLKLRLPPGAEVAVDIIIPGTKLPIPRSGEPTLTGFVSAQPPKEIRVDKTIELGCNWQREELKRLPIQLSTSLPKSLVESLIRIERELRQVLPVHLVPSLYIPIEKMPYTDDEIDRKQLQELASAMTAQEIEQLRAVIAYSCAAAFKAEKSSLMTPKESELRQLWEQVLGVDSQDITVKGSFFALGGDSIMAMKLVSAVRLRGFTLTVADIFRYQHLGEMASQLKDNLETKAVTKYMPFSLLGFLKEHSSSLQDFLSTVVQPLLADPIWKIKDVYPSSLLQEGAVKATVSAPRFSVQYNLMYFDSSISPGRLSKICQQLISHHEILRTVFIEHNGIYLSVVLDNLRIPLIEYQSDGNLELFVKDLCVTDADSNMPLGSSFVKFIFVKGDKGQNCFILRLSHAQYDGMSLPIMFLQLADLYNGKLLTKKASFSSYIYYTIQEILPASYRYWRDLLQGSSLTVVRPKLFMGKSSKAIAVSKTVDISGRPWETTIGTVLVAGWSLVLARFLSVKDVVFGQIVAGRSIEGLPEIDSIMGPCDQHVPIRVRFKPRWSGTDLLRFVREQYINSARFESIGFREIAKHCVSWEQKTEWETFDSVVHHHDINYFDTVEFGGTTCRLDALNPHEEPAREWKVQSYSEGERMVIEIVASESWRDLATLLLENLGDEISALVKEPWRRIF